MTDIPPRWYIMQQTAFITYMTAFKVIDHAGPFFKLSYWYDSSLGSMPEVPVGLVCPCWCVLLQGEQTQVTKITVS